MIIGSHVSMAGKEMLLGSVKEALSYHATTFMFYTGAPQNTKRKRVEELRVDEALALMQENNIDINNIVVHAPYIINLANTLKPEIYELGVKFLKEEILRTEQIGMSILVLHPGSHVKQGEEAGIASIIKGLNEVIRPDMKVKIALETMAGKGSELGYTFEQLKQIIDGVEDSSHLGICMDTCHMHDAGYDVSHFDDLLDEFDRIIGLDRLFVIHVNDSKNERGARKDRHENIGNGYIGFEALDRIANHPSLISIPKILETPYIEGKAPYKEEIKMLIDHQFVKLK